MKRGHLEIWTDILLAIERHRRSSAGPPPPSRVRATANVPTARFQTHLAALAERGLVSVDPLEVTTEGHRFVAQVRGVRDLVGDDDETGIEPGTSL